MRRVLADTEDTQNVLAGLAVVGVAILAIVMILEGCSKDAPSEPKRDLAFVPNTTQAAKELCAHLEAVGCIQRTECVKERDYHLATRDMRLECLMAAKDQDAVLACGTVTCLPPSVTP